MIVYSSTKENFEKDVINGRIASKVEQIFKDFGLLGGSYAEIRSWENSLPNIAMIINDPQIPNEAQVAIEYQIPLTSKRVDFMIGGNDGERDNVIIVELKQWDKCEATDKENVVIAFTGGANREVPHPSQQAYSYAKLIENLNESVRNKDIGMVPCAYLHNYKNDFLDGLFNKKYKEVIEDCPVFVRSDGEKFRDFIAGHIKRPASSDLFDIIENGKLKPSKALQDAVGSVLNGNQEFMMIDEQQVAYATVLQLVKESFNSDKKHTIIVQGGPGTGKSVIAINLLAKILQEEFSCVYVTKNGAPRYTFSNNLVKGNHTIGYLKGLFKGSGSFIDVNKNVFDCILVDEAHRLNEKSGMFNNKGENQIKEIINASKVSVFFIDEDQIVTTKDIGSIDEIKKWANELGSNIHFGDSLKLTSQFRCNGSDGYLAFLDDVLDIRKTANSSYFDLDYDVKVYDSPTKMRNDLKDKNINNKARMIAGYCYPWNSQNDKTQNDIFLEDGFNAQWNFDTNKFATDSNSFEQVGCIHSTQGLEFDYVGIIIGNDLRYENNKIVTDPTKRAASDASIKGYKNKGGYPLADKIIKNTYKTLLSRGQKGCYIYCEDKNLREYIKERIKRAKNNG